MQVLTSSSSTLVSAPSAASFSCCSLCTVLSRSASCLFLFGKRHTAAMVTIINANSNCPVHKGPTVHFGTAPSVSSHLLQPRNVFSLPGCLPCGFLCNLFSARSRNRSEGKLDLQPMPCVLTNKRAKLPYPASSIRCSCHHHSIVYL